MLALVNKHYAPARAELERRLNLCYDRHHVGLANYAADILARCELSEVCILADGLAEAGLQDDYWLVYLRNASEWDRALRCVLRILGGSPL